MPNDSQNLSPQILEGNKTLSDILLLEKQITQEQYDDIKVKSASKGVSEDTIIESLNIITPDKLAESKAKMLNIPFMNLDGASFSPQAIGYVPRAVAERFALIPLSFDEKTQKKHRGLALHFHFNSEIARPDFRILKKLKERIFNFKTEFVFTNRKVAKLNDILF